MTFTDFIVSFLSIVFMIGGASRGFVKSLIIPFSIIVAISISIIYFQITHEVITSLALGLISPFFLHLLLRFLLKIWTDANSTIITPDFLSRLGGAIVNLLWGWVFVILILIVLAVFPTWGGALTAMHDDVSNSASYIYIAKPFGKKLCSDATPPAEDHLSQEALQDPDIQKDIDTQDIVKLISNPKMIDLTRQVLGDPATMKRILGFYSSQANQNP